MAWYKQKLEDIYTELTTTREGISSSEAKTRLKVYGRNEIQFDKEPWWKVILEPFRNVFMLVLGVAATISLLDGEALEAIIVLAIILINAIIFYTQHFATTRVLRALQRRKVMQTTVLREGHQHKVPSSKLVPGDIILLSEGEKIPADARVIDAQNAQVDEASLTGESVPVSKLASHITTDKELYEQDNMLFQGTYVVAGEVRAIVVATGLNTEFGRIAKLASAKTTASPLQQKINRLISMIVRVIAIIVVIVFALALLRGLPVNEALRFVISISVSAVPEGLPVALTVIFVLGMRRMAKRQVLVRSFKAIEDVGLITTIATDKTGTLTKNHLSVVDSWSEDEKTRLLDVAAKTIDINAKLSDPLDIAIEESSSKADHHKVDVVYPFDLSLRMSGAYVTKDKKLYIKGSPEHLLSNSNMSAKSRRQAESAMHELAAKGYRVIALATVKSNSAPKDLSGVTDVNVVGLLAFADELRPEARKAIDTATSAGISVRLITGDHYETAYNIAKNLGIASHPDEVIQGHDLPRQTKALAVAIRDKRVFARILPEDKYRILQALKVDDIVAMTGDGVNDVPAIASAHVGIAMGSGSDIARDASGMILVNDNFASIVMAISEGRRIYDNVRRMLFYLLSTTVGEIATMVGALLIGLPLPVTAIQILWINLVTDTAMVLPLGLEPAEKGHMKRPPRPPKTPLLKRFMVVRLVLVAATMAITNLVIVAVLYSQGRSDAYIQTIILFTIVAAQWVNALNARSETESIKDRIRVQNKPLLIGFGVAIVLQALVLVGPLGPVFNVQVLDVADLVWSLLFATVSVLVVVEAHKLFMRLREKRLPKIV